MAAPLIVPGVTGVAPTVMVRVGEVAVAAVGQGTEVVITTLTWSPVIRVASV